MLILFFYCEIDNCEKKEFGKVTEVLIFLAWASSKDHTIIRFFAMILITHLPIWIIIHSHRLFSFVNVESLNDFRMFKIKKLFDKSISTLIPIHKLFRWMPIDQYVHSFIHYLVRQNPYQIFYFHGKSFKYIISFVYEIIICWNSSFTIFINTLHFFFINKYKIDQFSN